MNQIESEQNPCGPFLRTIAGDAAAVGVVAMPPRDFLGQVYSLLEPAEIGLFDEWLRKTSQYEVINDLMKKIDVALLPRIGFVSRRNIPDPSIPVETTSSMPEVSQLEDRVRADRLRRLHVAVSGGHDLRGGRLAEPEYDLRVFEETVAGGEHPDHGDLADSLALQPADGIPHG